MLAYERLRAWSLGHELTLAIYRATEGWPPQERYGLTSQLRRAAASVPTTLAEGSAKRGTSEYRRFVDIALGAISEVAYLLRLGTISDCWPRPTTPRSTTWASERAV